jgi:hypothetical protein
MERDVWLLGDPNAMGQYRPLEQTSYRAEVEVFGWSFVFWSHILAERFETVVEDTAAHTPWWCKVPGALWKALVQTSIYG